MKRYLPYVYTCMRQLWTSLVMIYSAMEVYVSKIGLENCTYTDTKQAFGLVWAWCLSSAYGMQGHCRVSRTAVALAAHASFYSIIRAQGHGEDSCAYISKIPVSMLQFCYNDLIWNNRSYNSFNNIFFKSIPSCYCIHKQKQLFCKCYFLWILTIFP